MVVRASFVGYVGFAQHSGRERMSVEKETWVRVPVFGWVKLDEPEKAADK